MLPVAIDSKEFNLLNSAIKDIIIAEKEKEKEK